MTLQDERAKEIREAAVKRVIHERFRQDNKWGIQRHCYPLYRVILGEELGEADQAWLQTVFGGEHGGSDKLLKEMVQSCAVLLAMIETQLECGGAAFVGANDQNAAGKLASVLGRPPCA